MAWKNNVNPGIQMSVPDTLIASDTRLPVGLYSMNTDTGCDIISNRPLLRLC